MDAMNGANNPDFQYGQESALPNYNFGDILIGNDPNFLDSYFGNYENLQEGLNA